MQKTGEIKQVKYERESRKSGYRDACIEYIQNVITFEDETTAIRLGIQFVNGKTIEAMAQSLLAGIMHSSETSKWWSLQTTSEKELKAAYRSGFRHEGLTRLEEHIKAFNENCTSLQMERGTVMELK